MVKVVRDYKMSTPLSYGRGNSKTEIVIHETGNTRIGTTAKNHHDLQMRGNSREASWHYTVDDSIAYQSFGESLMLWHSGTHANKNAISIEICVNRDGDFNKAVKNAIELAVDIAKRNKIPLSKIFTHHHYTGKNCPQILLSNTNKWNWAKVYKTIGKKLNTKVSKPSKSKGKSIKAMALQVAKSGINGHDNRRKYLGISKKKYELVRAQVNRNYSNKKVKTVKSINEMATMILKKNINGHDKRRKYLGISKERYKLVRQEVNKRMR